MGDVGIEQEVSAELCRSSLRASVTLDDRIASAAVVEWMSFLSMTYLRAKRTTAWVLA